MQALIDVFWKATESNDARRTAFEQLVKEKRWDLVDGLYVYLWRANWNIDPADTRYNMEFRKHILCDPVVMTGLHAHFVERNRNRRNEKERLPEAENLRDRLIQAWGSESSAPDEFQQVILKLAAA